MKAVIFALFLTLAVATTRGKQCTSKEDCKVNECCIGSSLMGFTKGHCKQLAKKDGLCSNDVLNYFGKELYFYHCACAAGLTCEVVKEKDSEKFGEIKLNKRCVDSDGTDKSWTEAPEEETEAPSEE